MWHHSVCSVFSLDIAPTPRIPTRCRCMVCDKQTMCLQGANLPSFSIMEAPSVTNAPISSSIILITNSRIVSAFWEPHTLIIARLMKSALEVCTFTVRYLLFFPVHSSNVSTKRFYCSSAFLLLKL